jgi:membrane protease YdiL (CAAX protease family)
MADLQLAASVLTYALAFLVAAFGLSRIVHSAMNFFSPEGSLAYGLIFALVVAALTALFRRLEKRPSALGLARGVGSASALASGAMLGAFAFALVVLLQWTFGHVVVHGIQTGLRPTNVLLASLAREPGVGFAEELAFRGQILSRLRERAGFGVAAALSSLLFAGCHFRVTGFGPAAFVGLLLLGLLLACLVQRTGALWASIGFHAAWNFTQGGVFGLAILDRYGRGGGVVALEQRGPVAMVGAGFLPEGGLVTMAVLAATVLVLWPRREGPVCP